MTPIAHRRALPFAALLLLAACAGLNARQKLLLPRLRAAWPDVASDFALGADQLAEPARAQAMAQGADLGTALESGDYAGLASANWGAVKALAMAGIDLRVQRAQISAASAASFRELVNAFGDGLAKFLERGG